MQVEKIKREMGMGSMVEGWRVKGVRVCECS